MSRLCPPGALPGLVVIGAPKAGTTSLARWLAAHPQVRFSQPKELQFLDRHAGRGLDWYRSQLPPAGPWTTAEATPTYLSSPQAPGRAAALLPDTRFVAVLREPVARAWSNYWFFCQLGVERRSWAGALRADAAGRGRARYLELGRYAGQLERWEAAVGRERLLVVLFDDLQADPAGTFAGICRFAGLADDRPPASTAAVNPTQRPRSRLLQHALRTTRAARLPPGRALWQRNAQGGRPPAMHPQQAAALRASFAPDNARLERWLGRPLPPSWSP